MNLKANVSPLKNLQRMHLHTFVLAKALYPMLACQPPKKEFRPKHKKELDQLTKFRHMKRHVLFGRPIFRCYRWFWGGGKGLLIFSHGLKCWSVEGGPYIFNPFLPANTFLSAHLTSLCNAWRVENLALRNLSFFFFLVKTDLTQIVSQALWC